MPRPRILNSLSTLHRLAKLFRLFSRGCLPIVFACLLLAPASGAQHATEDQLTQLEKNRANEIRDHLAVLERATRIVGGERVPQHDFDNFFPWVVSIGFVRDDNSIFSFCGGSLIAPDWVVTAAHCKVRVGEKVILGRRDLTTDEGDVIDIAEVFNHPDYSPQTNDSDIALLHLVRAASQEPIPLGDEALGRDQDRLQVLGWGLLEEGGSGSTELIEVDVTVLANAICQVHFADTDVRISNNMLCAGRTGKDSCQGDSGGPGIVADPHLGVDRLVGVVSFGIGCAQPGFPGVYTRVAQFLDWIDTVSGVTGPSPTEPVDPDCQCP